LITVFLLSGSDIFNYGNPIAVQMLTLSLSLYFLYSKVGYLVFCSCSISSKAYKHSTYVQTHRSDHLQY